MSQVQIKEQLNALIDSLPADQAELLLDFAVLLRQRQMQTTHSDYLLVDPSSTAWERALAEAENYWFQLHEAVQAQYRGQTVAILHNQILDADKELAVLRERVTKKYPEQPVLYLPADAEQVPPLLVRSPRFR